MADNLYEDILNPLAALGMDISTLTKDMVLTAEQQDTVQRMRRNVTKGMETAKKLGDFTKTIVETAEAIYPNMYWARQGAYLKGMRGVETKTSE